MREKMRGMFRRGHHDCGCDTCNTCTTCSAPACNTCNTCDSCCEESWGHRFRNKMRGMFRRGHHDSGCGCDTGCGGCGSCGGAPFGGAPVMGGGAMGGKTPEQIGPPKGEGVPPAKMPEGGENKGEKGALQINVVPNAPIPASAPALNAAPVVTPAPEADNREQRPF